LDLLEVGDEKPVNFFEIVGLGEHRVKYTYV
jgi:hypothetical protein